MFAISGKSEVNEIQMFPDLYIDVETPMFLFNERNFSCCLFTPGSCAVLGGGTYRGI